MESNLNFGKMNNFGLSTEEIERIRSVFSNYQQVDRVLIFGSRAMGTHRLASDIDLALFGQNLDSIVLTRIEFDLDDLLLPYTFDLCIFDKLMNPEFRDHINRVGLEFFNRDSFFE